MSVSPSKVIESTKNPFLKSFVKLKDRRTRDKEQRYLIEGTKELNRASEAKKPIEKVIYSPKFLRPEGHDLLEHLNDKLELIEVSKDAFEKLSMRQNPDGLLAVAVMQDTDLDELTFDEHPLFLVIDGLEKPGNVGALLRTADAVNVDAVFVTGKGTDLYNPNVIRSSVGSVFSRPVLAIDSQSLIAFLKKNAVKIIATSPSADKTFWQENLKTSAAIVLGPEHEGLDESCLL